MIPILYRNTEKEFKSNGIGRLSEAITCRVTEERNGIFELEMTYPVTGMLFKDIIPSAYIKEKNVNKTSPQVFSIYKVSKPINGIITVHARHISYQLSHIPTSQFKASSASSALAGLKDHAAEDCPFEFWTDKVTDGDFSVEVPSSIRSKLGGSSSSILDVYGGEYEFDNFLVKLHAQRGRDNGVTLRYGKNITDIKQEENIESTITGVYPYWLNSDGEYMELPEKVAHAENASNFPHKRTIPLDCSADFEEKPTEEQLRSRAKTYLKENNAGVPKVSITVSFVALWQTEEYKDIAPLEKVNLCDTVSVEFLKLNISAKAKVVKTVYNVLLDRYDSIEIGESTSNLATEFAKQNAAIAEKPTKIFVEKAAANATNWLTGVDGGYVVFRKDANNKPYELLIMDTEDISTATNVWRFNKNGWGFSNNGYNGTYIMAATIDGRFLADIITAGTMLADRIRGGTLTLGGVDNGSGVCTVLSDSGNEVVRLDKSGVVITSGTIDIEKPNFFEVMKLRCPNTIEGAGDYIFLLSPYSMKFEEDGSYYSRLGPMYLRFYDASDNVLSRIGYSGIWTNGSMTCTGTKSREVETENYGNILEYCYEMASPVFGDIGTGTIGEDGMCYVYLDPVFLEAVSTSCEYQVFLQKEGSGDLWVAGKNADHFIVEGTTDLSFSWEVKVKQRGYELTRQEYTEQIEMENDIDYAIMWAKELENYEAEVTSYGNN